MSVAVIDVEDALGIPRHLWGGRCHEISLGIVRTMLAPGCARVARGWCRGVPSQHSWVVVGMDCYDEGLTIWDPTLWSYMGEWPEVWVGNLAEGLHTPHGSGSIWEWGKPAPPVDEPLTLTPTHPWSDEALLFLDMLGPLDKKGWIQLAHAPVEGWPAGEIIDAMLNSGFEGYVPIDIVGMNTLRNPSNLYLREE